jgi:hypothetical protein
MVIPSTVIMTYRTLRVIVAVVVSPGRSGAVVDPSGELYEILDRAGLSAGHLLSGKKSMPKLVNEIRSKLVTELRDYIERRDDGTKIQES